MENSAKIFALALGLDEPWFIEKVAFDESNSQLDIYINFTRGNKFSTDDGQARTAYDTVERKWQHLTFLSNSILLAVNLSVQKKSIRPHYKFVERYKSKKKMKPPNFKAVIFYFNRNLANTNLYL